MARYPITATALIPAPASKVYNIIADYHVGHPSILPEPYFVSLNVEEGGIGAGTVITFQMRLMGKLQTFHAQITEPQPGRVLVETNAGTGDVTSFTVEPGNQGNSAQVTITTEINVRDGILGKLEGWMAKQVLRPVYIKELQQLAVVATK